MSPPFPYMSIGFWNSSESMIFFLFSFYCRTINILFSASVCFKHILFTTKQVWTHKCAVLKASVDVNISYY